MASSVSEPRRPRIGLSTYLEVASWGVWSRPAAIVPQVYLDAVTGAGGQPVLLPPTPTDPGVLDVCDGLLLIGGADVEPAFYGALPHPATDGTRPARDRHERHLFEAGMKEARRSHGRRHHEALPRESTTPGADGNDAAVDPVA